MKGFKKSIKRSSRSMGKVGFDPAVSFSPSLPCVCCGGEVEVAPMRKDTCYDCYRKIVDGEIADPRKAIGEEQAYAQMDTVLGVEPATQREMESMVDLFLLDPRMIIGSGKRQTAQPE